MSIIAALRKEKALRMVDIMIRAQSSAESLTNWFNVQMFEIDDLLDVDASEVAAYNRKKMQDRADKNWEDLQKIASENGGAII